MNSFGFLRLSAVSPRVAVGNPLANVAEMTRAVQELPDSDVIVFPELAIPGYTCADLFGQQALLDASLAGLAALAEETRRQPGMIIVGLPVAVGNSLYNAAAVVSRGQILGIVPKQFIPNYKEFYESRWFSSANGSELRDVPLFGSPVPFGVDLLFEAGRAIVGVEICEDLWMPIPPSSYQAIAGANVLVNLSASNETIGKNVYREQLVVGQSGRCLAAYAYASSGPTESTTDLVFGGHCLIAENGVLLNQSPRVGGDGPLPRRSNWITADVDLERLQTDRRTTTSFDDCVRHLPGPYRRIPVELPGDMPGLKRSVPGRPFVPAENSERHRRCAEIFGIQQAAERLEKLPPNLPLQIGVSGGLDSTLALLAVIRTCDSLQQPRTRIHGLTLPGFGTTSKTRTNALQLMQQLGVSHQTIDIRELCLQTFRDLNHRPFGIDISNLSVDALQTQLGQLPPDNRHDLVFENVQARLRTFLLMSRGFVIGTGDLSESALGWSTYNGDHMSMYNPNCSIPKTLVRFLVQYAAESEFSGTVRDLLLSITEAPISPELLPLNARGEAVQATEDSVGPYELHDFFLYHMIRGGCSPTKILFLAAHAEFTQPYSPAVIRRTLQTFYRRFFANQFKRSCVPDGPKVGSISLSPRGDWRMPSDADVAAWLAELG